MEDMLYVEGERVYLRELKPEDVTDAMMEWFQDAELMRFYTNSGRKIDKAELCHSIQKGRNEQSNYTLGIYLKAESRIIGTVKIGPINWKHKISDLATLIGDRNYLGKGFSTEAIALGGQLAFSVLDLRRLYGGMYWSNKASIKTYLKAGWIAEGVLKGFYWVDGKNEDRLLVGCYNPLYFSEQEIMDLRTKSSMYYEG